MKKRKKVEVLWGMKLPGVSTPRLKCVNEMAYARSVSNVIVSI